MIKERLYEIDTMKGVGILLVILGHCVPDFPVDLTGDDLSYTLVRIIYSFHMPLFFFCSGFVLGITPPRPFRTVLKSRFERLILPYFVFSFVSVGLRVLFSSFTKSHFSLYDSLTGIFIYGKFYWFIYVLFFVLILMELFKKTKVGMAFLVFVGILLYYQNVLYFKLYAIGFYLIFAVIGFYLSSYRTKLIPYIKKNWVLIILFFLFVGLFLITPLDLFATKYLHRVTLALAGISFLYCFSLFRITNKTISLFIDHFSKYSLQYYLIHMIVSLPCYYIVSAMGLKICILSVLMNFILITAISFLILEILLKIKWSYKLVGLK